LASILRWQLGSHYHLEEEVPIGQKPLQIDILLLQKEHGNLPDHARAMLAALVERLGDLTLIELKSPSDTLRAGERLRGLTPEELERIRKLLSQTRPSTADQ
jgi:hypothetical protein